MVSGVLGYTVFNLSEPEDVMKVRIIWIVTVTNHIYNATSSMITVRADTLAMRLEHQVHFQ